MTKQSRVIVKQREFGLDTPLRGTRPAFARNDTINKKLPRSSLGSFTIDYSTNRTTKLSPSPLRAIFAVFDGHAQFFELVADLVGTRPLFLFARFVAFCDQCVDLRFLLAGALSFLRDCRPSTFANSRNVPCAGLSCSSVAPLSRAVLMALTSSIQCGDGACGVEVIVHGVGEDLFWRILLWRRGRRLIQGRVRLRKEKQAAGRI